MGRSSRGRAEARKRREMEAARAASAPPAPLPPSRFQRFRNRIGGIPGASLLLGLLQLIWRYWPTIFRRGEDTDFLFGLWTKAGGDFPMLIQAITSPFFGLALILGGIGYAALAKEPDKQVPSWVPKIGWAVIGVCALLLSVTFLFDEFLRESHIGQYVTDLTSERHVTEAQRVKLKEILAPNGDLFKRSVDVAAASSPEAGGFAIDLMSALDFAGLKATIKDPRNPTPPIELKAYGAIRGVYIIVANPDNPPKEASVLLDALNQVGIKTVYSKNLDFWIDNYVVAVGPK
jgi:hypothetical protein